MKILDSIKHAILTEFGQCSISDTPQNSYLVKCSRDIADAVDVEIRDTLAGTRIYMQVENGEQEVRQITGLSIPFIGQLKFEPSLENGFEIVKL